MFPGGKGGNQAVAAARLGGEVVFISSLGNDVFGQKALEDYEREGIHSDHIVVQTNAPSGVALITVNEQGENEIVVASGANELLSSEDIENASQHIDTSSIVLTQLETPLEVVQHLSAYCKKSGIRLIINPAPARALDDQILDGLFLITPNETETQLLTGVEVSDDASAITAVNILLDKGVQNVIITLGKKGAFFMNREKHFTVLPPKVEAVDTTAAGDVFNGALAVCLAEGMDWRAGIDRASKAAAVSVTRMGAQSSAPTKDELTKIFP